MNDVSDQDAPASEGAHPEAASAGTLDVDQPLKIRVERLEARVEGLAARMDRISATSTQA